MFKRLMKAFADNWRCGRRNLGRVFEAMDDSICWKTRDSSPAVGLGPSDLAAEGLNSVIQRCPNV